jgi:hypothetical protein
MTKLTSKITMLTVLAGFAASVAGCSMMGQKATSAHIPLANHVAELGMPVNFDVSARVKPDAEHHWTFNGLIVNEESAPALGLTGFHTPRLEIKKASLDNCGFYRYEDERGNASETAELLLTVPQVSTRMALESAAPAVTVVVYGTPVGGRGGSGTACPGAYQGYVQYINSASASGGWMFPKGGTATDANGNTVVFAGVPFSNNGCGPKINASTYPYHFTILFKGTVPSGPYPLTLKMNN